MCAACARRGWRISMAVKLSECRPDTNGRDVHPPRHAGVCWVRKAPAAPYSPYIKRGKVLAARATQTLRCSSEVL